MSATVRPPACGEPTRGLATAGAVPAPAAMAGAAPGARAAPALAALLIVSLLVRVWGIEHGLPYVYNVDEAQHFVPHAIAFFDHGYNPRYFLNPPAYSYLLYAVFELWFGPAHAVGRVWATDPTAVFVLARVVSSTLGLLSIWLIHLAGRRLFGTAAGLLAAAVLGFAFLPVFYSHLALNDVPTLAPVSLSLYGVAGAIRRGRTLDYLTAGAGVGLAAATKYTGGITLVCLIAVAARDLAPAGPRLAVPGRGAAGGLRRTALGRLAAGLLAALAAFVLANPYSVLDFQGFWHGIAEQASLAAGSQPFKLGMGSGGGIVYYLWTFTWGLGWAPSLAAIGGVALLLARRRFAVAATLVAPVVAFILFMGVQQRYFGRWLLPVFPIAALLAGHAGAELVRAMRRIGALGAPLFAVTVPLVAVTVPAAMLAQSLLAVVHDDLVLSRPDTRTLLRAWMVRHVPAGSRVVIEPVVPAAWDVDPGGSRAGAPAGERWRRFPVWLSSVGADGRPLPSGRLRQVPIDEYERTLRPGLLDVYVRQGYCWVVTGSLQSDRAYVLPRRAPGAIAYYAALARRATLVHRISPYARGAGPVAFNFDFATDYYPLAYRLPGPVMDVWRLRGGVCGGARAA